MGLNLNLVKMCNAPETVFCPKCGELCPTHFDDFDIECSEPSNGVIKTYCYCERCDEEWKSSFSMVIKPLVKENQAIMTIT